jgi:choline transporter-like protein 2/4/5
LNDGTYVQTAVTGKGYCRSTLKAYSIVADNLAKMSITDGISMFFTLLGVMGIGIGVTVGAYFACESIEYLAKLLTNPLIVTITAGLIGFVVAGVYLSLIDLSAQSIIQCYFIDH